MKVIHKNCKELIEFIEKTGDILINREKDILLHLPFWYKKEGNSLVQIPFSELTEEQVDISLIHFKLSQRLINEQTAIGFSDWQRTLVFTEKDIWLKEKTTKELYDLYLQTL